MKFIFPQNYKMKNKIFGIMDYSTIILNIIWNVFLFKILSFSHYSFIIKTYIFVLFSFPLLLFSIFGFNRENFLSVMYYLIKYLLKPKLYFYNK